MGVFATLPTLSAVPSGSSILRRARPSTLSRTIQRRPFAHTAVLHKKKGAGGPRQEPEGDSRGGAGGGGKADPLDFADLEAVWAKADAHFAASLKTLVAQGRSGGASRFDAESLGGLRVAVKAEAAAAESGKKGGGAGGRGGAEAAATHATETYPLRELAAIVPRTARSVSILAHEARFVKAILSAVQASPDYNQQPQRVPGNELELLMKVEMDAKEGEAGGGGGDGGVAAKIKKECNDWRDRVRHARAAKDRALAKAKADKDILPDDKRRAEKEMQKMQDKKLREVDEEEKKALKGVAR